MINYKFESEWDENTNIAWWKDGRTKLNVIIRMYNKWQIDGFPSDEKQPLIATIICGLQTFASQDGGSNWAEVLERMKQFVEEN